MARVLFAQEIFFEFMSTMALSAYLKRAGHQVDIVIGSEDTIVKYIKETNPDLIAFSILTPYRNFMLSASRAIKASGIKIPIIAGGYDITFLPQVLEHADLDIICLGEGGEPLVELCKRLDAKEDYTDIANLHVKRNGQIYKNSMRHWMMNMDTLPFDDRDLYSRYSYFKIVPFTQVLAGRGCPYLCTYCFNHGYRKLYEADGSRGYTRLRSVGHLMKELLLLKNKYNARYLFFNDSTLSYNKRWLLEFLEEHAKQIRIPFSINSVASELDEEICAALEKNGYCKLIRFGLETGNEEFRRKILKKNITNEQLIRATGLMKKHNIRYSMAMMFGLPGETEDLAWETIEFARRLSTKGSVHAVNIFKPFPGLDIVTHGLELGQYNPKQIAVPGSVPEQVKEHKSLAEETGATETKEKHFVRQAMADTDMCFYENYRTDEEGERLVKLSRFSHVAIRIPLAKPLVKRLIQLPDNFLFRLVWKATEGLLNIRVHADIPFSFFVKYALFYRGIKVR